jgi:alkylmercury lyase-like protein
LHDLPRPPSLSISLAREWGTLPSRPDARRLTARRAACHNPARSKAVRREDDAMSDPILMDRMFQRIMRSLVDTGRAPHHAELARAIGLGVEDGRLLLHEVMRAYPIGWLHPETDYIASFPPLNNLPTQYRITVRGEQRWFAQCGFEATSVTWLFPGETVRVDAPCLDCGDPVTVEMRDGRILWVDPPDVVGHLNFGFGASRGRPHFL